MTDKKYGGAGRFASTGGWTLAEGDPMDHYSKHRFIGSYSRAAGSGGKSCQRHLSPLLRQFRLFSRLQSRHGMLGLLELMASQGVSEEEMYKAALAVNSYWFSDTYITIAKYLKSQGKDWSNADPKEILGYNYSSGPATRNSWRK